MFTNLLFPLWSLIDFPTPHLGLKQKFMDRNRIYVLCKFIVQGHIHTYHSTIKCECKIKGLLGKLTSRDVAE